MNETLKRLRLKNGLTQEDVAKALGFSSPSIVTMWESGDRTPRTEKLVALARLYKCTVDDLLKDDEETQHKAV